MSRPVLMAILALDILILGSSGYVVWERVRNHWEKPKSVPSQPVSPLPPAAESGAPPAEPRDSQPSEPAPPAAKPGKAAAPKSRAAKIAVPRRILFQYRDPLAGRVAVAGTFNQWSPQLMQKKDKSLWTLSVELKPGEYAYNFIVDGRMIRDPSSRKSRPAGQKIPSSILTVKAR